jgi:hypothetical protein
LEATQLNRSEVSERTSEVLRRISSQVMSILQPFILELIFWRDPSEGEENSLILQVRQACQAVDGTRHDIGDLASLLVKSGDAGVVIPSILPEDDRTRMSMSISTVGPGQPIVARVPFADQRAETFSPQKLGSCQDRNPVSSW